MRIVATMPMDWHPGNSIFVLLSCSLSFVPSASRQTLSTVYEYVSEFNEPFTVEIMLYPLAIHTLDIVAMEFRFEAMSVATWKLPTVIRKSLRETVESNGVDPSLEPVYLSTNLVNGKDLWRPDLYFVQAKKVSTPSNSESSKVFMGHKNLTEISLQERLSLRISCQLDLKRYPFDSHRCQLQVRSFLLPATLLQFKPAVSNLTLSPRLRRQMIGYEFEIYLNETKIDYGEELGEPFKTFLMDFRIDRRPMHQILTSIVPSTMLVLVGFSVFLMDASATAERISLSVVTLLTQYTQLALVRRTLPPCSYVTNNDAYMFASLTIILLIVIECIVLDNIHKQGNSALLLCGPEQRDGKTKDSNGGNACKPLSQCKLPSLPHSKRNSVEVRPSQSELRRRLLFFQSKVEPQATQVAHSKIVRHRETETCKISLAPAKSLEAAFLVEPRAEKFDKYCCSAILLLFAMFSVIFWLDSTAEVFCFYEPDEFGRKWKKCRSHFF